MTATKKLEKKPTSFKGLEFGIQVLSHEIAKQKAYGKVLNFEILAAFLMVSAIIAGATLLILGAGPIIGGIVGGILFSASLVSFGLAWRAKQQYLNLAQQPSGAYSKQPSESPKPAQTTQPVAQNISTVSANNAADISEPADKEPSNRTLNRK